MFATRPPGGITRRDVLHPARKLSYMTSRGPCLGCSAIPRGVIPFLPLSLRVPPWDAWVSRVARGLLVTDV